MRMTLPTHADKAGLQAAIEGLHTVLSAVDTATGQAKVRISSLADWEIRPIWKFSNFWSSKLKL